MTKARTKKSGRPAIKTSRLRDYRANLLLDDLEEQAFKRILAEMSRAEDRSITGAELLRRQFMPFLRRQAERMGLKLNPPKPTDLIPIRPDLVPVTVSSGRIGDDPYCAPEGNGKTSFE